MELLKFAFWLAAAVLAPLASAQTVYDKIELGNTVSGSINLGSFATPYPLPPGKWKVLKIKTDQIALSSGQSTPRWYFFMLETTKQSAIHSLLITITPDSSSINWGNVPCKAKSAKNTFFVETLDTTVNSIEYFCGMATKQIPLKAMVDSSSRSTSAFTKDFLSTLVDEPDLPKEVVEIALRGSKDRSSLRSQLSLPQIAATPLRPRHFGSTSPKSALR